MVFISTITYEGFLINFLVVILARVVEASTGMKGLVSHVVSLFLGGPPNPPGFLDKVGSLLTVAARKLLPSNTGKPQNWAFGQTTRNVMMKTKVSRPATSFFLC